MRATIGVVAAVMLAGSAWAKKPVVVPPLDLSIQWVRQSEEYKATVRGVYQVAGDAAVVAGARLPAGTRWVVVADADETLIDNSLYQVEVGARGYTPETWAVWETRGAAVPMPGAVELVARVHAAGGQFAFITNRSNRDATLTLLQQHGLWEEGDRLCTRTEASDKGPRRASVREGTALCGWEGQPATVVVYLGDQLGDFPKPDEEPPNAASPWGSRWFMLPNPMYGGWVK